ncbi:MAG: gluconate 2-dehydrogenase subunit 3 family protein [Deltaproteobacteria bacterium]|nr:gluconate 2-dehydrogenase subunit 3 family protein [Deltaproteobacteria bacterium]
MEVFEEAIEPAVTSDPSSDGTKVDRRRLLEQLVLFSLLASCRKPATQLAAPDATVSATVSSEVSAAPTHAFAPFHRETLDAIANRILPPEGRGPSAAQARATEFIDRELSKPELSELKRAVQGGLLALDRRAAAQGGRRFKDLTPSEQDELFQQLITTPGQGQEFARLLVKLVLEGTFGDPAYGGNAGNVGFELAGYAPPKRAKP